MQRPSVGHRKGSKASQARPAIASRLLCKSKAGSLLAQTKKAGNGKKTNQKRPKNEPAGPYFPHICFGHMC